MEVPFYPIVDLDLNPCPFCGSPGEVRQEIDGCWEVICSYYNCTGAQSGERTMEGAIAHWNRRV